MTFIHGCNYPWSTDGKTIYYGLDFGANIWGSHLGVSTRRAAVAADFARMATMGFTVVRWFVLADGRAGIVYDDSGLPAGPDAHLFVDLDAALEIARDTGIRLTLALLDHRWMFAGVRETIADPATGALLEGTLRDGRSRVLSTPSGHDALFDNLLLPMVQRYGPRGERADLAVQIFAWELINEPDFLVQEWEQDVSRQVRHPLPFTILARLIGRFSDLVHAHSRALTTLGGARARNLWAWDDEDLGLDVLQVHQYPDLNHPEWDDNLFGLPSRALQLRRPVIIGEYPCSPSSHHPAGRSPAPIAADDYMEFALTAGYAGAWPWSFSGTDDYGSIPEAPLRVFGRRHPELVNPRFNLRS